MQLTAFLPIFISAGLLILGHSLLGILVPLRGQLEGFSPTAIGAIGAGFALGFTIGCFFIPQIVRKVGHIRAFAALSAILSCSCLLAGLYAEPIFWFLVRAITGMGIAGSYMIMESWLNERTSNANRGSIFSIYMIITQGAFLGGQFILVLGDVATITLFVVAAMAFSLSLLPTALTGVQSPAPLSKVSIDISKLYENSKVAVIGSFLSGVIASAWGTFAPVFGQQVGYSNINIAFMMGLAMVGGMVFQYPIGRLSDLLDRRLVIIGCGLLGAILGVFLYATSENSGTNSLTFFILIFLFGSVLFTIYSLSVAHANDYAEASDFVAISSGLLVIYGVGTMIGPLVTAFLFETIGVGGLFAIMSSSHIGIALFTAYRLKVRVVPDDFEPTDFQVIGAARTNTPQTYEFDPRSDEE